MEKVLIVDDSILQGMTLKNILDENYDVYMCQSGEEAIKEAAVLMPNLILLDIIMQGISGFETLSLLKEQAATKNIPVILITSLSDAGNEELGLELGAVDYIIKPFNASIVRARAHTHIQLYSYRKAFETLAMIDGLTGIPNRRYYDDQSESEWLRAMRDERPLSIGLMDVDFFKQYNDIYGHPKGDEALKRLADCLSNLRRASDFAARYGGEEFVFLMPNTSGANARRIAYKICQDIEALGIPHKASPTGVLTVSIGGITVVPARGQCYAKSFKMVDDMLYRSKKTGRNKVSWSYKHPR